VSDETDQDWQWIERFQEGDTSAFDRLFQKHKRFVINLAFRFVRQKEIAEDLAQEVFVKVHEKKVKIDFGSKFSTWLYRVTVNASIDFLRRKKFFPWSLDSLLDRQDEHSGSLLESVPDLKSLSAQETLHQKEACAAVHKAIDALPEKLRAPILLYQFENLSYLEIAQVLQVTPKAVERRIYHAKEILRKKLENYL
jgi:RNA polymerase sigma-70 factor (ECF subfamily)